MSSADRLNDIRRILIALDASPASQAALELAADLALRYQAELIGIYVEDVNLLRSADIPFTEEVGTYSAASRQIDSSHIERELRAHAHRVEQLLSSIAQKANLRWSFRSTRGLIPGELMAAASGSDLIVLGKTGWSGRKHIGSTAREIALGSPIQSLILMHRVRPDTPVMVVYDGSTASKNALAAARTIINPESTLTVLIKSESREAAEQLEKEVRDSFQSDELKIKFRWVVDIKGDRISQLALISNCDVVVMPAQSEEFDPETLVTMLDKADCAVLLVR
jgi:nucleotide-binding universal stress UspA family protein